MVRHLTAELFDDVGAALGEGPSWDQRTEELVSVDILGGRVFLHDAAGNPTATFDVGGHVGAALPAEAGGWLLVRAEGFSHLLRDGSLRPVLAIQSDPELRFNDAKCDPHGQALAGTMRYDETAGSGALYRLEVNPGNGASAPAVVARVLLAQVGLSNGLGWSAAGDTLYFIDSLARSVTCYAYRPDAALGAPRQVVAIEPALGLPDGLCVDDDGALWVALFGGAAVHRYRPDGRLDTVVHVPVARTTSVTFGGVAGDRLFITTAGGDGRGEVRGAGGLWSVDPGTSAPPATPWRAP